MKITTIVLNHRQSKVVVEMVPVVMLDVDITEATMAWLIIHMPLLIKINAVTIRCIHLITMVKLQIQITR